MRTFPVIWPYDKAGRAMYEREECPRRVPWSVLAPHEKQAMSNHGGQSLERLAERGGLSPKEMFAVIGDRPYRDVAQLLEETAIHAIKKAVAEPEWADPAHQEA